MATATALTVVPLQTANAEPAPVTGVELGTTLAGSVAVNSRFDFTDAYTIGLPELKKLRGEMWDINPPFDGVPLRQAAAAAGLTTRDAYVNAVAIDANLTRIAVQRAAEQPLGGLTHDRAVRATIDGRTASGEVLSGGRDMKGAISKGWGHGELAALRATNGHWSDKNGHLHILLNPKNRYYGFGHVNVYAGGKFYDYSAGVSSRSALGGTAVPKGKQSLNLYRPAAAGERPTGLVDYKEPPARPGTPSWGTDGGTVGDGQSSASDVQTIIGIIAAVVSLLSVLAGLAQQFMR